MHNDKIYAFCDGACKGNPGPGGWGYHFSFNDKEYSDCEGLDYTTNNGAELTAILKLLECLNSKKFTRNRECIIHSDSDVGIKSIVKGKMGTIKYDKKGAPIFTGYISLWLKNGWQTTNKTDVKNKDLIEQIMSQITKAGKRKCTLTFKHVPRAENVRADELANQGYDKL